jgi:hypothetical protein
MAKSAEKIRARELRRKGESIKVIARQLHVSKSTVSIWCLDIELSEEQIDILDRRRSTGGYAGRLLGSQAQKQRRIDRISYWNNQGRREMPDITDRDLLMAGLGLYIGEGTKSDRKFQFSNSNPQVVNLMIKCLEINFKVSRADMYCRVLINEIHACRTDAAEEQWSTLLNLPREQFRRTILIKAKNKKVYANYNEHLGTLALRAKRDTELQRRILGLTAALMYNAVVKLPA